MNEKSTRKSWGIIAAITIASGSVISFSPIGFNLLNVSLSEPRTIYQPTESNENKEEASELRGLRNDVRALSSHVNKLSANQKHPHNKPPVPAKENTPSVINKSATAEPGNGNKLGLKKESKSEPINGEKEDVYTLRIKTGNVITRTKFKNREEEIEFKPGTAEVLDIDITSEEDIKKALGYLSKFNDAGDDRIRKMLIKRQDYYAATHFLINKKNISIEDFPSKSVKKDHLFVDFADVTTTNPKIIYKPSESGAYALSKKGEYYTEKELLSMEWANCSNISDKKNAIKNGGWEAWYSRTNYRLK